MASNAPLSDTQANWQTLSPEEAKTTIPAQINAHYASKTKKKLKARSSRKAPSIKTAVTLKRLQGQDKTSISRDLGIARNTVTTILEENDVERIMQDGQIETLKRVPAALKTLDARLEKNSENAALWLLDKCFDGKEIAKPKDTGLTLAIQNLMGNVTVQSAPETKQEPAIDVTPCDTDTSKPSTS